jgi:hypothetical protein
MLTGIIRAQAQNVMLWDFLEQAENLLKESLQHLDDSEYDEDFKNKVQKFLDKKRV